MRVVVAVACVAALRALEVQAAVALAAEQHRCGRWNQRCWAAALGRWV
jgi:hypothetical protein